MMGKLPIKLMGERPKVRYGSFLGRMMFPRHLWLTPPPINLFWWGHQPNPSEPMKDTEKTNTAWWTRPPYLGGGGCKRSCNGNFGTHNHNNWTREMTIIRWMCWGSFIPGKIHHGKIHTIVRISWPLSQAKGTHGGDWIRIWYVRWESSGIQRVATQLKYRVTITVVH